MTAAARSGRRWWSPRRGPNGPASERTAISAADLRSARVRWSLRVVTFLTFLFLLVCGLGPIVWMLKSSVTPTQDTLRQPLALWPHGIDLGNLATARSRTHIDLYVINTRSWSRSAHGSSRSSSRPRVESPSRSFAREARSS
jgi:multiple sugar transport system permease protein